MDDETAEIELLEQNLNKTRQISQRMTSILTSFDGRLVKLEKSILPLYTSTQILTKRGNNIEAALQKIDEVASNQEGIAAEEALILRGPQPEQLAAYTDVLERLNAGIAFNTLERDSRDTARLVETGAKKLAQLFTKLVAGGSSGTPLAGTEFELSPFPQDFLITLQPLVTFLRTLPLPATHPSHPAANAILSTLKDAQRGYADMRGNWGRKCLEVYARRVVERAETIDGVVAGRELGNWVNNLLDVVEEEYGLLTQVGPLSGQAAISATYISLLTPLISLFNSTLTSLLTLIKRSLHKFTFHALSAYSALAAAQTRWDDLITRRAERKENELKENLTTLRGVCLRSFPEFLADIKLAALGKGGEVGTGLADFSISSVRYLEQLIEVRDAVEPALVALGDGNWKMGDGVRVANQPKLGPGSEHILLEHYIYDVVSTVITSLTTLSRMQKRPAFGSVFLLNNIAYLRTNLLKPRAPLMEVLSRPTQDTLNSSFRTAKAGYFDSNFSPLIQALSDEKDKSSGGKAAAKEKFTRFFDLLEETKERHKLARVLEDDEDNQDMLADEVVRLVVPSLQRFVQKQKEKEFSKNPSKYIKLTPEEVEAQIRTFF
ncbi:exocyst complex component exo70 subunit [Auriscalpium vulgare]|uniref:Exocyst complex component exo70 subunit n=1 Tax=Auriscalpium vulgare TaxID=40419 RepID=A0ACB8S7D5_9AGAM|nr:exocyst complex component exo70 subunit [Auriscalpium vulgare]